MKFEEKALKRVDETGYLNRENTSRYRGIIRVMYRAYEKMKYNMYRQDILEALSQFEQFEDYTDEMLKSDLEVLVSCGNIFDRADATRASTPEEFINKIFIYQLSPATIEIERMLIRLENISSGAAQKSSLESSYIEDFRDVLLKIYEMADKDSKARHSWWNTLNDNFKKFSENYKDYISDFYSSKTNELIQTTEFLVFKERFIIYLRNFISGVQMNASAISSFMEKVNRELIEDIISDAAQWEASIPQLNFVFEPSEYMELNLGKYDTMTEWFLWINGRPPLYEQLIGNTNEIIRKITRLALQILDKRNLGANRKRSYLKLMDIFAQCQDVSQAHKVSALAFGVSGTRHILAEEYRDTDSISSGVYDEPPRKFSVTPNTTKYREKLQKTPIPDFSQEKEARRLELMEIQKYNEAEIKKLITNNKIDLATLPQITYNQRMTILSWFSKKIKEGPDTFVGETDFGAKFKITELKDATQIRLDCEDGVLYMPHYIIEIDPISQWSDSVGEVSDGKS